jgi:hypothetical protein
LISIPLGALGPEIGSVVVKFAQQLW